MQAIRYAPRTIVVASSILLSGAVSAAAVVTHLPSYPVPEKPIALRVDDRTVTGGNVVGPHTATVSGQTIRIEGCLGTRGLPIGGPYSATLTLTLPVGNYSVQYYRNIDHREHCEIGVGGPLELVGTGTLTVAASGPGWPPPTPAVSSVYEYVNQDLGGHFFITSIEDEKLAIETGRFSGWVRYGPLPFWEPSRGYGFFTSSAPDLIPVCRFFSAAFAPRSTHFYTTNAAECEFVKQNPTWTFEGVVGYVWPSREDGSCAQGVPLFRLYNNGQSGAPNHFYTESVGFRSSLINSNWIPEGVGPGVIACVPPRP